MVKRAFDAQTSSLILMPAYRFVLTQVAFCKFWNSQISSTPQEPLSFWKCTKYGQ